MFQYARSVGVAIGTVRRVVALRLGANLGPELIGATAKATLVANAREWLRIDIGKEKLEITLQQNQTHR